MSAYELAKGIRVDPPRIYKIVKGERGISGDTALRLARYFGNAPEFWINLQSRYELEMARYEGAKGRIKAVCEGPVRREPPPNAGNRHGVVVGRGGK